MEKPFYRVCSRSGKAVDQLPGTWTRMSHLSAEHHLAGRGECASNACSSPLQTTGLGNMPPVEIRQWARLIMAIYYHGVMGGRKAKVIPPRTVVGVGAGVNEDRLTVDAKHKTQKIAMSMSTMPFTT